MVQHNADDGLVMVMEVATGHIKAISNLSKDGNGNFQERFNFATAGLFEPGSTFKLVTMIALLEDSEVELADSIDTGNGEYTFYKNKVKDHEEGGLGKITVRQAFEHSSNVAMAKLVDKNFGLRPQKFIDHVDHLKLNKPIGIQIPCQNSGARVKKAGAGSACPGWHTAMELKILHYIHLCCTMLLRTMGR